MDRMILVILKLSVLFAVGMCGRGDGGDGGGGGTGGSKPQGLTTFLRSIITTKYEKDVWKPLTFLDPILDVTFGDKDLDTENEPNKRLNETSKIYQYLIKNPDVNKKLLKATLDFKIDMDAIGFNETYETEISNAELGKNRNLEFADTVFKEVGEQLPFKEEELQDHIIALTEEQIKNLLKRGCYLRKDPKCKRSYGKTTVSKPKFVWEFFALAEELGLTKKELIALLEFFDDNEPAKRKVYEAVLNFRLYYDNIRKKFGKGKVRPESRKGENRNNILRQRIKAYELVSRELAALDIPSNSLSTIMKHKIDKYISLMKSRIKKESAKNST